MAKVMQFQISLVSFNLDVEFPHTLVTILLFTFVTSNQIINLYVLQIAYVIIFNITYKKHFILFHLFFVLYFS